MDRLDHRGRHRSEPPKLRLGATWRSLRRCRPWRPGRPRAGPRSRYGLVNPVLTAAPGQTVLLRLDDLSADIWYRLKLDGERDSLARWERRLDDAAGLRCRRRLPR